MTPADAKRTAEEQSLRSELVRNEADFITLRNAAAKYRCLARSSAPFGLVFEAGHELDVLLEKFK